MLCARIGHFVEESMAQRPTPRKVHHVLEVPGPEVEPEAPLGREVAQEVDFLVELLELRPEEAILEVASGAGRHALELARRGYGSVTAIDLSDQLLTIGRRTAEVLGVTVSFHKHDARHPQARGAYDAALVLGGGAFGLMESDRENFAVLDATFAALRPGGRLAMSAMSLLYLIRHAKDLSGFDPQTNYLSTTERIQIEGDLPQDLPLRERYYVLPGIKRDLEQVGFREVIGFGVEAGRFSSQAISTDLPEILVYAVKPEA
jgi:2-polyprenyl-3-methyl-5-hydroxy-6-metoxy-1,4-benzoquinol methylase